MVNNGKVWDRFDYIACICFTGNQERLYTLKKELIRVGLTRNVHFHIDFPSPITGLLAKIVASDDYHRKMFPIGYNNYRAIKTAYELGRNNILVFEDDIRFLKDIDELFNAIENIPEDFDLVMLDKNWPKNVYSQKEKLLSQPTIGGRWKRIEKFFSSGCYALSRKGMERWCASYESDAASRRLCNNDEYFNIESLGMDCNLYAAFPNVAVQGIAFNLHSASPLSGYWKVCEELGGFQNLYQLDFPIIQPYNFISYLEDALARDVQNEGIERLRGDFIPSCSLPKQFIDLISAATWKLRWDDTKGGRTDVAFIWGNGNHKDNVFALQNAYKDSAPVILCEDGFIRSGTTFADDSADARFKNGYSIIFDAKGYYFDASRVSTIEMLLNDENLKITSPMIEESKRLIHKIVSNKISKYNHQPIFTPTIGRDGVKKVLVIDQSYGDFSIKKGMADDTTFDKMLQAAIDENPDADILVKTHPDTIAGKKAEKKGYYQDLVEHDNIYKVTFPINPYSLLEVCDKVYVCSSQFGLEALMAGKEVHVFGMPFYAGWGLTIDNQHLDRRTNKRTLEELFYIFYCLYTHWVDPEKKCETTIDAVIEKMLKLREEYKSNEAIRKVAPNAMSDDGFGIKVPLRKVSFLPRKDGQRKYTNW